jgi:hypothetical protein
LVTLFNQYLKVSPNARDHLYRRFEAPAQTTFDLGTFETLPQISPSQLKIALLSSGWSAYSKDDLLFAERLAATAMSDRNAECSLAASGAADRPQWAEAV